MDKTNFKNEVATMSYISFEQSLPTIKDIDEEAKKERIEGVNNKYLNTMVLPADRKMVKALKAQTGLSEGAIVREIFSQWREFMLRETATE